jgi:hypothetical protein
LSSYKRIDPPSYHLRIQVDVVPSFGKDPMLKAAAVNYFREGASFLVSPVSPSGPLASV